MGTALIIGTWGRTAQSAYIRTNLAGRVFALSCFGWLNSLIYFGWIFTVQGLHPRRQLVRRIAVSVRFAPVITSIGCVFGMWFKIA